MGFCCDCGTHYGSRTRVFSMKRGWHTLTLCFGCIRDRIDDGEKVEGEGYWLEQREDARADDALAER